jgi:hypothetical protein
MAEAFCWLLENGSPPCEQPQEAMSYDELMVLMVKLYWEAILFGTDSLSWWQHQVGSHYYEQFLAPLPRCRYCNAIEGPWCSEIVYM